MYIYIYIYIDVRMCLYIYIQRERGVGVISSSISLLVYAVQFSPNTLFDYPQPHIQGWRACRDTAAS